MSVLPPKKILQGRFVGPGVNGGIRLVLPRPSITACCQKGRGVGHEVAQAPYDQKACISGTLQRSGYKQSIRYNNQQDRTIYSQSTSLAFDKNTATSRG